MYKINFKEPIHIHFIGIGGISMSGLAEILSEEHFTVSGSDAKELDLTRDTLEHLGIKAFIMVRQPQTSRMILILSFTPPPSTRAIRNSLVRAKREFR